MLCDYDMQLYVREFVKAKILNMTLSNIGAKEWGGKNKRILPRFRVQKCLRRDGSELYTPRIVKSLVVAQVQVRHGDVCEDIREVFLYSKKATFDIL